MSHTLTLRIETRFNYRNDVKVAEFAGQWTATDSTGKVIKQTTYEGTQEGATRFTIGLHALLMGLDKLTKDGNTFDIITDDVYLRKVIFGTNGSKSVHKHLIAAIKLRMYDNMVGVRSTH